MPARDDSGWTKVNAEAAQILGVVLTIFAVALVGGTLAFIVYGTLYPRITP